MTEEWNLCAKCIDEVLTVYPKSVLSPKYIIYKTGECRWCKKKANEANKCEYLGVVKCSVSSCYRRGSKCKGYTIKRAKMDEKEKEK